MHVSSSVKRTEDKHASLMQISATRFNIRVQSLHKEIKILPPMNMHLEDAHHRQYTLVLDLDETLVHFNQRKRTYMPRPYCLRFLEEMQKHYELVVFTAGLKDYADWILNDLDKQRHIRFRLYRDSCRFR